MEQESVLDIGVHCRPLYTSRQGRGEYHNDVWGENSNWCVGHGVLKAYHWVKNNSFGVTANIISLSSFLQRGIK